MPHCCAYAISCNVRVEPQYRNKGIGTALNLFRMILCDIMGYTALICTDVDHNGAQRKILKTQEWTDIHTVINRRTGNVVHISATEL